MNQEEVRSRLIAILNDTGIKSKFICDKIGLTQDVFSRFKTGAKNLSDDNLEALDKFLVDHNA